jgi:hypothetical protein
MGGGSSSAPTADPNIGLAAMKTAQTGADYLDLMTSQYDIYNERQEKLDALTSQVTESQLTAQNQANTWAAEDRDRYTSTFQPLQDAYIEKTSNWDSAEKQAQAAGEAKADVMSAAAQQQQTRLRQQTAMGVNPASGRYAGTERAADTATALASAGAQNNARTQLKNQAVALQADAINMGSGMASQATQALGLGVNTGNSVVSNNVSNQSSWNAGNQLLSSGYTTAMQGYTSQANTLNNLYANQINAYSAENSANASSGFGSLMSGVGSLVSAFMPSDENVKTDKVPAKGALQAVKSMPIEEWTYKPGVGDGGRHIGTYAQDFQAATGKGDGKSIPVVDAIGVTMGAVKELSDKVDQIAKSIIPDQQRKPLKGRGITMEAARAPKGRGVIMEAMR